jgi:CheY-like chemotaxis protein
MTDETAKYILAADDQEVMRAVLKRVLGLEGYRCDTVMNGRQAIRALSEQSYDLALLDVGMPEIDGLSVLQHIRATPELAGLPVIMVTGRVEAEMVERCRQLGVTHYLAKPYQISVLVERIHKLLRT